MDILQEYYRIIENNNFRTLPSQELIDSDERVALAVWNNYIDPNYDNRYDDPYFKYDKSWLKILNKYIDDISFWKKANISSELFDPDFNSLFPQVCETLSKDKDYLLEKYKSDRGNQHKYIKLIEKLDSSNLSYRKDFLLNNTYHVNEESLKELQNDVPFLLNLMLKNSTTYEYLNEELKQDKRFIKLAAQKYSSFCMLNEVQQIEFIEELLASRISLKELKALSPKVKDKIMELSDDPYVVIPFFKEDKSYKNNLLELIKKNNSLFEQVVNNLNENELKSLFRDNFQIVKPKIESWLKGLSVEKFSNYDLKMIELGSLDSSLTKKINDSPEYNLTLIKSKGKRIDIDFFKWYINNLLDRIDSGELSKEKAESNAIKAKKLLDIEVLKEWKLSDKGILNYFLYEKINNNMQ